MNEATKNAFKIQSEIRHNAEVFRNTINDLYNWEKDIKQEEKTQHKRSKRQIVDNKLEDKTPVRSWDMDDNNANESKRTAINTEAMTKGNKKNTTVKASSEKRKLTAEEAKRGQANAYKNKGNDYVKAADYEQAMLLYTRAIKTYSDDPVFYTNRALCHLKMEKYNECIADCNCAIKMDGEAVKAFYRRMLANEALHNDSEALFDCNAILSLDPKNAEANKSLIRINERLNQDQGPKFSVIGQDMINITPINKPPHTRSKKPLQRVAIKDMIVHKEGSERAFLQVPDDVIDKLFNSDCGSFVEVKKPQSTVNETLLPQEPLQPPDIGEGPKESEKLDDVAENRDPPVDKNSPPPIEAHKEVSVPLKCADKPVAPVPTTATQFYCSWKELSEEQKYKYLKSIEISNLKKLLGAGFGSDTLSDILHVLCNFYVPNKEPTTAATLLEVSKHKEIKILSLLISSEEREVLTKILDAIKESLTASSPDVIDTITKNFNL